MNISRASLKKCVTAHIEAARLDSFLFPKSIFLSQYSFAYFLLLNMKLTAALLTLSGANAFVSNTAGSSSSTALFGGKEDLVAVAEKANPYVKFYDPMNLAEKDFWGQGNEATIGFLRQSEIKHGRIAMFAFVGYIVQSNFVFPWAQTLAGAPHPSADLV